MKPAAYRKAELADQLAKAGTADAIAIAIVDAIDRVVAGTRPAGTARQVRLRTAGRAMIRSLAVIHHRLIVGVLSDRGL